MTSGVLDFLEKYSTMTHSELLACSEDRPLTQGILEEDNYEVALGDFERRFHIDPPERFLEKVKEEYSRSLKPTVIFFRNHPEKCPRGYSEGLTLKRLFEAAAKRRWSPDDVYVIPKSRWLF
jgi:hypothetical protein